MKRKLRLRVTSGILISLMVLLAGCGEPADSSKIQTSSNQISNQADSDSSGQDMAAIEMPTADLTNNSKVLKVFGWSSMSENNTDGEAAEYFEEEFGVTIEDVISTHDTYWSDLAKMVAAGNAPDVVDCSYDKFWPVPVAEDLLEPWDELIDFDTPLWADMKEQIEMVKWNDKIYFPVISEFVSSWLHYNKNMFKNYGLENDTPRALYERDEWTLDKMCEISDMFIEKNNKNEITQWGFTPQNLEPISISGVQLVEIINGKEYKNNINDASIAKVMNTLYNISAAGSGSMSTSDACPLFEQEKVAMLLSNADITLQRRFEHLRQQDAYSFAPMPKLDAESNYNVEISLDPGYGLVKGAKNKELATLWVNYLKWFRLGEHLCAEIPRDENSPAVKHYNIKPKAGSASLSQEDIDFINKYLDSNPTKVYTTYRSIVQNVGDMLDVFKWQVFAGSAQWSAAVQQLYPKYEAQLKEYIS